MGLYGIYHLGMTNITMEHGAVYIYIYVCMYVYVYVYVVDLSIEHGDFPLPCLIISIKKDNPLSVEIGYKHR